MLSTGILLGFGVAFTAYECVAHFVFHNTVLKTASDEIRMWEGKNHMRRVAVLATLTVVWILLILHLVLKLF